MSDNLLFKNEDTEDLIFAQTEGLLNSQSPIEKPGSNLIGGIFNPRLLVETSQSSSLQKEKPKIKDENQVEVLTSKKTSDWHISMSPDGENFLTFNHKTLEFKVITGENQNLNEVRETKSYKLNDVFKAEQSTDNFPKWMVAISNCVTPKNEAREVFVAISRVTKSMTNSGKKKKTPNHANTNNIYGDSDDKIKFDIGESDELKMIKVDNGEDKNKESGNTVIYQVDLNRKSSSKITELPVGGIVIFVHNKISETMENETILNEMIKKTYCFIFNVNGIYRNTFTHDLIDKGMKHFLYPKRFQIELETLYKNKSCITRRLNNSIFDHYFFIEQYKEGIQVLQLYNLNNMRMEQIFNMHDGKLTKKFGNPIFARSNNERIIAFSFGFGKISLFLKENGLEIASEDFGNDVKILFCEFINNDETLIIIIREPGTKIGKVLFWNLFSTRDTIKVGKNVSFVKNEENTTSIARIPGKLITINTDGQISSVFDSLIDCENDDEGAEIHSIVIHNIDKSKEGRPRMMPQSNAKSKNNIKAEHKIYHRRDLHEEETKPIVNNKEPWVTDNYKRVSVYLDEKENTQLFIGRSTVQVWRKIAEKKMELEYIWTNNVDVDREGQCGLEILELYVGERCFYLKVRWNELEDGKFFEVKWPYRDNHVTPIKHACDALEHLNYRRNKLVGYKKQHEFEDMKGRISYIIWRFIKYKPNTWRLMDIRFDIMAKIIIGGSNTLVKYILFGDENEKNWNLHIPRIHRWDDKDEHKFKKQAIVVEKTKEKKIKGKKVDIENLSDLQIAIRLCKGGLEGNRRTLIVAYLLEYYTENSLKHIGWLSTVSEALPDLYEYKLENYAKEIFCKRCISGSEISNIIEYTDFTPKEIEITLQASQKFRAFNPISKLISEDKTQNNISLFLARLYVKIFPNFNHPSPTVKMVPLHNFTMSKVSKTQISIQNGSHSSFLIFLVKIFKFIFIPRGYLGNQKDESQLSPLVQIVRSEKDDEIFDNPAMEAAITYKWSPARNYFLKLFFRYILYAACFATLVWCYLGHLEATGNLCNFLLFLFILFYYLGLYLFLVECWQFKHHSWRHYLEFFNFVDLASIVTSLVIMSVYVTPKFNLSNAFADVEATPNITAGLSFTMLLLWFEFILYLRLLSEPAKYIYIMLNIIKQTYVFVAFMLLFVLALSHVFLLLLRHTDSDLKDIEAKTTSYTTLNNAGEIIGSSQQNLDRIQDNPSKDFGTSFLSTYDWLRGVYPQDATWNFWAVQALTLIGSLFLITIVQNVFIAFIWGVYTEAYEKGRVALLRFRADLISDYEALDEIHFSSVPLEPKYIYYLGKSKSYNAWEKAVKEHEEKNEKLYDDYEKKMNKTKLSFKEKKDDDSFWNYNVSNDIDIIRGDVSIKSRGSMNYDDDDGDNGDDGDDDYDEEKYDDDKDNENSYTKIKSLNDKISEILKNIKNIDNNDLK